MELGSIKEGTELLIVDQRHGDVSQGYADLVTERGIALRLHTGGLTWWSWQELRAACKITYSGENR